MASGVSLCAAARRGDDARTGIAGVPELGTGKDGLMAESLALNMDCMAYMRTLPDKAFDLAVVDPPYGDGGAHSPPAAGSAEFLTGTPGVTRTGGSWSAKYGKKL